MPKLKCAVNKGGKTFCNKRKQTGGKTVKNTSYKATKQKPKAKKPKAKKPMSKAYKAAIQREDNKSPLRFSLQDKAHPIPLHNLVL